ncbi:hypothetical protein [Bradyrhizobium japonicum]|uniref:hypothetical protein n=1 Tax=Bradyrhizobium japonicum TaxID=375 RepID=UPI0027147B22|nr:hypothetical protein [Bradyrhizobium japonicum]WLB56969.1 hypothetical protein QIH94_13605 [Bradyrhizobium japonicum]WLB61137.1 hypothetical protein QIH96_32200 [Bradyrhizobium japonicum]
MTDVIKRSRRDQAVQRHRLSTGSFRSWSLGRVLTGLLFPSHFTEESKRDF